MTSQFLFHDAEADLMNSRLVIIFLLAITVGLGAYFFWIQTIAGGVPGYSEGDKALDITVTGIDGSVFSLGTSKGKLVLIDFVTTSCPYCIEEFKELGQLTGERDLMIVSINLDGTSSTDLIKFAKENGVTWFLGSSQKTGMDYKVNAVPTLVLIDKTGTIRYRGYYTTIDQIKSMVAKFA